MLEQLPDGPCCLVPDGQHVHEVGMPEGAQLEAVRQEVGLKADVRLWVHDVGGAVLDVNSDKGLLENTLDGLLEIFQLIDVAVRDLFVRKVPVVLVLDTLYVFELV